MQPNGTETLCQIVQRRQDHGRVLPPADGESERFAGLPAANCTDCHVPHPFFEKYYIKAKSGFNHVYHFTFGSIPEPIRAKEETDKIIQENCIYCHSETVSEIADGQMDAGRYCFECHRDVAHGERGVSILPYRDKETDQ